MKGMAAPSVAARRSGFQDCVLLLTTLGIGNVKGRDSFAPLTFRRTDTTPDCCVCGCR